jgi:hypothetical protein
MVTSNRTIRSLVAIGLAVGLLAAACGSSSTSSPTGPAGGTSGPNATGGASLTSGLSYNLANLDSYKFTWSLSGSSSGTAASPGDSGALTVSGTIINKPSPAASVNDLGMQFIVIGNEAWLSSDGNSWTTTDPTTFDVTDLLPSNDYATWFDANSTDFTVAGEETKNGIDCIHYTGNSSLGAMYAAAGVSAQFQADLWVAKNGNYPVSGVYGFAAAAGGQSGAFYYTFDITNVNDASNTVAPPTNVISVPT